MTIPASGSISLSTVRDEHGGNLPLNMSQLLRSNAQGSLVHSNNTAVPAAPPMSLSQFLGTSRSGYYPMTVGLTNNSGNLQYGVNVTNGNGSFLYNNRYKGQTLGWFLWNAYDLVFGVALYGANIPQSLITSFGTSRSGAKSVTGYNPNFFGFTVWNNSHPTNPFGAVGTVDNSPFIL
jgi:hypothetical protein